MSGELPIPPWLMRRAKERLRFTTLLMIVNFLIAFAFDGAAPDLGDALRDAVKAAKATTRTTVVVRLRGRMRVDSTAGA